jgi:small subunit ribosomal protein S12
MTTVRQLFYSYKRKDKKKKSYVPRLDACPQKKGTVQKVFIQAPKKPNSAKRKVARVKLSSNKLITCHLPGIGHNLQQHSVVLVRGGRCQDLIGVRYKPIRGLFDFAPVKGRKTRRSKYGIKGKPDKLK